MTVIDAHAHLWTRARTPQPWIDPRSMAAIDRDFVPADLAELQRENRIDGAIVVQSSNSADETRDLLAAADGVTIRGVVGWVDLTGDVPAQLAAVAAEAGAAPLVGIRHLAHQDPDPRWLARPDVGRGLDALAAAGLPFDLVVLPEQLGLVADVVAVHPATRFVLDHLGKPPIASGDLTGWEADLRRVARAPHVAAKLSGLVVEADWHHWTVDELRPVVDVALDAFGAGRLMFGTDWPVVRLAGDAPRWIDALDALLAGVSDEDRRAVFAGTAERVYLAGVVPAAGGEGSDA